MRSLIASTLALLVIVLGLTLVPAGQAHAAPCQPVQRYAVGGNGDTASANVPGNRANRMNITYRADVFQGNASRVEARNKLDREAHALRARCPGTRIEVYAYSLGASAATGATDWWQTDPRMNYNIHVYLYGNPRRPLSRNGYGGIEAAGLPHLPFYTWWGPMKMGRIPVTDRCNLGRDIVCDSPSPIHKNLGHAGAALNGYLNQGHWY
ncbi:serine hydrolase [Gordonia phage Phendrix]|uniref:Lysin B n=1 Tax=Gordonia phage Phendrix TaxID=2593335 RepID=A0A514U142_9CAUD|nr:serine hydrolase [Gordonia phage Phendrix]QDK02664.1 serine hydrolase [Gordonia phage Phendrix]